MKKYELTEPETQSDGTVLYRIRALRAIPRFEVEVGDLGGLVQSEENLSQDGDCWIDRTSMAIGNSRVEGNAKVITYSTIKHKAKVCDVATIRESTIKNNAKVYSAAHVHSSSVGGDSLICFDLFNQDYCTCCTCED